MEINKLAIVDHVGIKSGMDCYNIGLLNGLDSKGIETYLFSNIDEVSNSEVKAYNFFEASKKSTITSLINFTYAHIKSFLWCKKLGINTIIIHLFSTYYKEFFQYHLAKLFGLEVITIVHDVDDFLNKDNHKIKDKIYRLSKYLIVHNQFCYNEIAKYLDAALLKKVHIIPHGNYVDFINKSTSKAAARKQLGLDSTQKYLLFFGQIKEAKGLDLVIKAMPNLPDDIHLIIAGRPRRFDYTQYTKLIDNLGIRSRVKEYIRFIENEERDLFFRAADVLVLPYRRIYQSGVLLMAMSHGLPTISSDLPANKEIITNGVTGLLFESENEVALSKAISQYFQEEHLIKDMQAAADKLVTLDYAWDNIALKYLNFFQNNRAQRKN